MLFNSIKFIVLDTDASTLFIDSLLYDKGALRGAAEVGL